MVQKVLILGSGFVAKPVVDILAARPDTEVTVACRTLESAKALAGDASNTRAVSLDVSDTAALDAAVAACDLVISLIPYTFHVDVIKSAIKTKKTNVLTTSYLSPAIRALDKEIKDAGIIVWNEIGVDPGIDHLYAVKAIDEIHKAGGEVTEFTSFCGGLPAPEASDNPLGYKFSWSPRGVLLALRNDATYYKDGELVRVAGKDLMKSAKPYFIYPGFSFYGYGNRDSTIFRELYKIPEAKSVLRGSLRYPGFTEFVSALVALGFLDETPKDFLTTAIPWKEAFAQIIGAPSSSEEDLLATIDSKVTFDTAEEKEKVVSGFRWLGFFSETPITPRGNPLDTICALFEKLMEYAPEERDMVVLQHKFGITWKDGSKGIRTSTLVDYGDPNGYSSMAKLVGTPCALAATFMLDGKYTEPGIYAPYSPELCDPYREVLKDKYGIFLIEKTVL
ncbi:Saccharopine dehydrogenase [Limtongia smithiae]|uniref:Saccharopine dehydrogenase n=1 Tax=Limtongia smithiae TaxID=1125753 RepID=UPI0034D01588